MVVFGMLRAAVVAALLVLPLCALAKRQQECIEKPLNVASPKWYRQTLPVPLDWLRYDGISPFLKVPKMPSKALKGAERQDSNSINLYLQGRGSENPLAQDPFGAGMRVSTRYAYKAGKVCAWMRNPDPRSGTIIGMYLIDVHPKGSSRWGTTWREVDYEWLGSRPDEVATSIFKNGKNVPNDIKHKLSDITGSPGVTQRDSIYYCINWDLRSANNKTVELTARAKGKRTRTVRRWSPETEELNKYWDVPLRAVFTYWSNKHIVGWSGSYNVDQKTILKAEFKGVTFRTYDSEPFCVENDNDLGPANIWEITGRRSLRAQTFGH